jgi:hypothetical protein
LLSLIIKKIFLSVLIVMLFCGNAIAGDATITLTEAKYMDDETPIPESSYSAVAADRRIRVVFKFENAESTLATGNFSDPFSSGTTSWATVARSADERYCDFTLDAGRSITVTVTATDSKGEVTTKTVDFKAVGVRPDPDPDPEPTPTPSGGGGGGGCNAAGFSVFALAGVAFACKKRAGNR